MIVHIGLAQGTGYKTILGIGDGLLALLVHHLGNPNEVKKIPTYSGLREQWIYNSGAYLFFVDDLLADYRL